MVVMVRCISPCTAGCARPCVHTNSTIPRTSVVSTRDVCVQRQNADTTVVRTLTQTQADAVLIGIRGNEWTYLPLGCSIGARCVIY